MICITGSSGTLSGEVIRQLLLGPNVPRQTQLELNAVEAAKAAGVRHIVKQSVMRAVERRTAWRRSIGPVEVAIETSGLAWTFLRPN